LGGTQGVKGIRGKGGRKKAEVGKSCVAETRPLIQVGGGRRWGLRSQKREKKKAEGRTTGRAA